MPSIIIDGPPIADLDKKRDLIREMTESAFKAYGIPKQAIVVLIKENTSDNVGVGGELLADKQGKES
ncbi:MAG: tautomerase family protein [Deltaproteobacteria bacterium]|nr:tautomerase family protein [Deltaproteobacteria bacterium]